MRLVEEMPLAGFKRAGLGDARLVEHATLGFDVGLDLAVVGIAIGPKPEADKIADQNIG
ncbi:hypothetical protein [Mesorhizobium atlanticum]|uniref:hypothetical protein n=1 Tax=Mesorhizobium atlanticum TaxID=2233532 RepID=UPI001FE1B28E|nr:hypothetical protein [Mesorhizobium atlanticum]